jgi:PUA domain protein
METDLPNESVVAIMAEGKEHALAIGLLKMSTEEM